MDEWNLPSSLNIFPYTVLNVHVCLLSTFLDSTWLVTATAVTASLSELAKVQWPSTMSVQGNVRYIEKPKLISSAAVWLHQMKVFTLDPSFTHPFFHRLLHTDNLLFHSFSHSHPSIPLCINPPLHVAFTAQGVQQISNHNYDCTWKTSSLHR